MMSGSKFLTLHSSLFTFKAFSTLLFGVAVFLFFGLAYPHHLHHQEQYQLFLFDSTYVWDVVRHPGGVADLLGRFCTQFFLFAWVGAFIIALLLMAVQLLMLRLFTVHRSPFIATPHSQRENVQRSTFTVQRFWRQQIIHFSLFTFTFVPSFLLWLFLLDENALLGGVWAVLLTLLAAWLLTATWPKLSSGWMRCLLLVIIIPVLYILVGPAWSGTHYHRYPTVTPYLLYAAWVIAVVLPFLVHLFTVHCNATLSKRERSTFNVQRSTFNVDASHRACSRSAKLEQVPFCSRLIAAFNVQRSWRQQIIHFSLFTFTFIIMMMMIWKNANFKAEKVMQYDFMACHQQWNRILATVNAEKPNNQIGVTVQNLALAMHGMLADHLFDYNQNGLAGLLPDVQSDATSPMPTAEAFYQLGMINVAQRTVFEAQEAILDFQKSGRCYKRLAQTNLINGNYEVARKYLTALQKTLFYRDWANETLPLLGDEEAIARHPEYGRLRQYAYKDDAYFSDHVTPEMLESLYYGNTDNRLAYQYLVAYYVLTNDRERYAKLLQELRVKN